MGNMVSDSSMNAARMALDGLAMRQQMISRNIANVDTPGFTAQQVNFEQVVKQALQQAEKPAMNITHAAHFQTDPAAPTGVTFTSRPGGSTREDGNNVDIDNELIDMNETALRYQALTQMISQKFQLIKSIATSR